MILCISSVQVPAVMPASNKPNPAMGVRTLAMSSTGRYLATVNDSQRAAVWLWDLHVLSLVCVLKHEQPVVSLMWDPVRDKLALCTASRRCATFSLLRRPWICLLMMAPTRRLPRMSAMHAENVIFKPRPCPITLASPCLFNNISNDESCLTVC